MSQWPGRSILAYLVVVSATGCSSSPPPRPLDATHSNLMFVGNAYMRFVSEKQRPPTAIKDLEPYLKEVGDVQKILASPRDGQPFVICWGVDLMKPLPWAKTLPVLAYEKVGAEGDRWVLTTVRSIERVKTEAFLKADFPPGHKPPS